MAKYTKMLDGTYKNNETGEFNIGPNSWQYADVQAWLRLGNVPDQQFTSEQTAKFAKNAQIAEIDANFKEAIKKPVLCTVNGVIYEMDCKEDSATRLKHGIEFAELVGATTLDIVDFYNNIHKGVSLTDCYEIVKQQAGAYISLWQYRAAERAAVLNS